MAISSDDRAGVVTLDTVRRIRDELHGNSILGISNISFGLPHREWITASYFTMTMTYGLNAIIMNPNSFDMWKAYYGFLALSGFDEHCMKYLDWAGQLKEELKPINTDIDISKQNSILSKTTGLSDLIKENGTLENSIVKGLKIPARIAAIKLLETEEPLYIIEQRLVPALDYVGKGFEQKILYMPQLLMSAEAAKEVFSMIKEHLETMGKVQEAKGRIILATVKGDIHDIGKNIVKVLLENYGYDVIDLGKDVEPSIVVETCVKYHVQLVGLSALMTTTVPAMEETIKCLRKAAPWAKVIVGGAVLNQEYADMIGADYYGKDAMETVKYAEALFKS